MECREGEQKRESSGRESGGGAEGAELSAVAKQKQDRGVAHLLEVEC